MFSPHPNGLTAELDLHGYLFKPALEIANIKIREAYDDGLVELHFVHGGGAVRKPDEERGASEVWARKGHLPTEQSARPYETSTRGVSGSRGFLGLKRVGTA